MGLGQFFLPRNAAPRTGMSRMSSGRQRHALGKCKFCPEQAALEASNGIKVCRRCAHHLR